MLSGAGSVCGRNCTVQALFFFNCRGCRLALDGQLVVALRTCVGAMAWCEHVMVKSFSCELGHITVTSSHSQQPRSIRSLVFTDARR
jgi:hypothetical protein